MDATQTIAATSHVDLIGYARQHRLHTRNLHDAGPVPPPRRKTKPGKTGYLGAEDRMGAIVGRRGYVIAEGGGIEICLFFKSSRGVGSAKTEITALHGRVTREGDCELAAWLPTESLDAALRMIRVSKLRPPSTNPPPHGARKPP